MSTKKIIWLIVLLALAGGIWYGYKEYNRSNKNYKNVEPHFSMTATELIREYETNDTLAAKKYNGRDIEVTGNVRTIEKDEKGYYTIVLGDGGSLSSVRCSMDTIHAADAATLVAGSSATIRGACAGFYKDELGIGSDVTLNLCAIINKKDQ